ncbi:glycoside hydrolase family 5 protein [Scleroderma yunnanense]
MPRVPPGQFNPPNLIHTLDGQFVDASGRTLLLRGVNLSGSSKAPPGQPSYVLDGLWESAEAGGRSFIGHPLPLDEADEHLSRLRGWGFNMLRYPITWEALEHEGPGTYDYEFMDYTISVLRKCKAYGFKVYLDPHQDTWSRFSGGSGAPYWTIPACGINPRAFTATQAAILHCEYPTPTSDTRDPASLPAMVWSTNYGRLASQTLFALFFGGRTFAPKCVIDGVNIQDFLQSHFINAFATLAQRIRDAGDLLDEVVIGWDCMNEPAEGFIEYPDLNVYPTTQGSTLKKGTVPTPAQSLRLGMGQSQTVDNYSFGSFGPQRDGTVTIDPLGVRMWSDPSTEPDSINPRWGWRRDPEWTLGTCIWALHGVWDIETGYILQPDYFRYLPSSTSHPRMEVDFLQDFYLPQITAYFSAIRIAHPHAIAFVQAPVFAIPPAIPESLLAGRACAAPHFYDGLTLVTRHWNWFNADALGMIRGRYSNPMFAVRIGERQIRACIRSQLAILKGDAMQLGCSGSPDEPAPTPSPAPARYPTIIGEIGTPFDMDKKVAYDPASPRFGTYAQQERALDASLAAADGPNGLSYTVWTYCTDSSHAWGDGWNMEDLSLWCREDTQGNRIERAHGVGGVTRNGWAKTLSTSTSTLATLTRSAPYATLSTPAAEQPHARLAFLLDGARAVRAFCRPWPVHTVGVPANIEFDIGQAKLRVAVRVGAEDKPQEVESEEIDEDLDDEKPSSLTPTEIFLPLVHFASDLCVKRALALANGRPDPDPSSSGESGSDSDYELGRQEQQLYCAGRKQERTRPYAYTSSTLTLIAPTLPPPQQTYATSPTETRIENDAYDITVKVSEGRISLCEDTQTLRWFYTVPTGNAEKERDSKEVWIEVKRTGGAIKYPRGVAGVAGRTRQRRAREGCVGWLWGGLWGEEAGWCPDSCVVM